MKFKVSKKFTFKIDKELSYFKKKGERDTDKQTADSRHTDKQTADTKTNGQQIQRQTDSRHTDKQAANTQTNIQQTILMIAKFSFKTVFLN